MKKMPFKNPLEKGQVLSRACFQYTALHGQQTWCGFDKSAARRQLGVQHLSQGVTLCNPAFVKLSIKDSSTMQSK